ncbi:hypothetical protein AB0G60_02390 [Streptomyces angustmyceticus]|uniref:Lipoprotein n=1 Tax=Streptomyces angustmyceticus TaxID=285578 RepID=A0A5J4L7Y8_9ACTN|nr:hypothetical protein [Streptomyces angustmyceticus]UAL65513.1 hypothetical protein K7396_02365 [Streptomyces angustmyceticus]GES27971.1 hypothetical protein San01_04580 [Streptomyces angustmyceticus]
MRIRAAVVGVILLAGLTAGCSQSYDEMATDCLAALKARPDGDKAKPSECEGLKRKDYTALVASVAIDGLGWTDEDGKFDKQKMLDSLTEDGN